MTRIKELEKLGMNNKEAVAYLALLELGEANLQRIAEKSKIKRTTIYDVLNSLKEKGLISTTKRGRRTYYYAENPSRIKTILQEKIGILENILPELLSITNLIDKKPTIKYFEGTEGIKNIYRDTLNYKNQEILAWISPEAIKYFDTDWLWQEYVPQRLKNKIWVKSFAPDTKEMRRLQSFDKKHLRKTKLINLSNIFEVEINLYGNDKIAIMSFKEEFGLIIESKKIYNTLKVIFELQWNF
jgi:sugar-specific transcriptional regulator TrmB